MLPLRAQTYSTCTQVQKNTSIHSAGTLTGTLNVKNRPPHNIHESHKEQERLSTLELKPHYTSFLFCGHGLVNEAPQLPHTVFFQPVAGIIRQIQEAHNYQ